MARRHHALESSLLLTALGFVLGAVATGLLPLLAMGLGSGVSGLRSYAWHVVGFTLWQAFLSTLVSLAIALPLARALAARHFPGREIFLRLMLLPQALPAIVVVLGLLGLFGEAGWLGGIISPYGLTGILLAHLFFNMPLATRVLLTRMEAIPPESYRLAAQLRFTGWDVFRHVEWPVLAAAIKGVGGLIFLLCTASFTVVLVLGGGPQATTLEVAIYQALRMDFDPGFAALLSLAQLLLCTVAVFAAGRFAQAPDVFSQTLGNPPIARTSLPALLFDIAILGVGGAILLPPLVNILIAGVGHIALTPILLWATLASIALASAAALLSLALGWILAHAAAKRREPAFRAAFAVTSLVSLIMPPAVMATGWFVILAPHTDVGRLAPLLIILLNALMAMPFVRTVLEPAIADSLQRHDRLCASLGLHGLNRLRLIEMRVLRKPLALAAIMAFILSLGDLAAITLFGTGDWVTLPALIYRQMGHYQMAEATGTALMLALFCLLLTFAITPLVRTHART